MRARSARSAPPGARRAAASRPRSRTASRATSCRPGGCCGARAPRARTPPTCCRSEEHTSELQSRQYLVCRLLLEKKKKARSHSYAIKKYHTQLASVLVHLVYHHLNSTSSRHQNNNSPSRCYRGRTTCS